MIQSEETHDRDDGCWWGKKTERAFAPRQRPFNPTQKRASSEPTAGLRAGRRGQELGLQGELALDREHAERQNASGPASSSRDQAPVEEGCRMLMCPSSFSAAAEAGADAGANFCL